MLSNDEGFKPNQLGSHIDAFEETLPDVTTADIILLGCGESRGSFGAKIDDETPDSIRTQFYSLYHWHEEVKVVDLGNIKSGATLEDTYAAVQSILRELYPLGKLVVILGGAHDLTNAQYASYQAENRLVNFTCIDATIDMDASSPTPAENFLLPIFTGEPNFVKRYNHIAFQSYYVHPYMLETIDKLQFDCYRVGRVKENIHEMEPVLRDTDMLSFDIAAIDYAHAPSRCMSPNGLTGEEACSLMQFAGMATNLSSVLICGHHADLDANEMTAKQISHMLWYLMDGKNIQKKEADLEQRESYLEFNLCFSDIESAFLQSKRTGRWWMELPDHQFIPCSYQDYRIAASNEIPERYFRAVDRM